MRMKPSLTILAECVALFLPCVARPCARSLALPIEVGNQFQVSVADRGRPVSGLRVVLSPAVFPPDNKDAGKIYSTTDSAGIAQFSDLSPGSLYVTAQYDGDEFPSLAVDISPSGHAGTTVEMTWPSRTPFLVRSASGILRNQGFYPSLDQNPISLELIEGLSGRVIDTTTADNKGRFSFKPVVPKGIYFIHLVPLEGSHPYDKDMNGTIPIEIATAAIQFGLDLDLGWTDCGLYYTERAVEPEVTVKKICGDVVDREGSMVEGAQFWLLQGGDNGTFVKQALSDPSGHFTVNEDREGTYQLIVGLRWWASSVMRVVHLVAPSSADDCKEPIHIRLEP